MSGTARLHLPSAGSWRAGLASDPTSLLVAGGVLAALVVGVGLAIEVRLGIAALMAVCYLPLLLINLELGLALWVPLIFLQGIPIFNLASDVVGLLIVAAWVGTLRGQGAVVASVLRRHRRLLMTLGALILWLTVSLVWAEAPGMAREDVWRWYAVGVLFVVFATTLSYPRAVRRVAYAFVGGAVISVLVAVVDGSLTSAVSGAARVEGGTGDPNFLAASVVAGIALAAGLLPTASSAPRRVFLVLSMGILIAGLVGSASRGGNLAAAVAIVAALVVFKHRRAYVVAATAVLVGAAMLTFASAPATWERVTDFDEDNGRSDLWYVAWEMGKDYPVGGVGLSNFVRHSPEYVDTPGGIDAARNIVELPHFAHNTYLHLFAEGGIVALALFLVVSLGCLLACKRAGDRFEDEGRLSLATLARAVLVATISMLAAATFLSAALDMQYWLLLALGPALLAIAVRVGELQPREVPTDQTTSDPSPPAPWRPWSPRLGPGV